MKKRSIKNRRRLKDEERQNFDRETITYKSSSQSKKNTEEYTKDKRIGKK